MNRERTLFGGWEPVCGKPGEYRAKMVTGSVIPEFIDFAEQSRARWDVIEYLKVKAKRLLGRRSSPKKTP